MSTPSSASSSKKRKDFPGETSTSTIGTNNHDSFSVAMTRQMRRLSSIRALHDHQTSQPPPPALEIYSPPTYLDLGDCHYNCQYCGASFWFSERVKSCSSNVRLRYNQCCRAGRARLQPPKDPPASIKTLHKCNTFMENIRAYNSMFAMTSFGANIDESLNDCSAPYVFKIVGQVSHWIGSLCPPEAEHPRFLQMYVYDTEHELHNRLRFFTSLNPAIVQTLINTLEETNELVKLFRTTRDLCHSHDVPDLAITLYNGPREVSYDTPSHGTLGAIIHETTPFANDFDIVIRLKDGPAKRVNKLHSSYMSLQYPLIHIYGEHGWSPRLRLVSDNTSTERALTMNMYYSYLLHDRPAVYCTLLRSGRLFQQYLVDAYVCIEQGHLDYIRTHQNLFRNEYIQGIHDALHRGDTEGRSIGRRTFLPSSFTGGPRYMYKHYQDALAICRVHGNPQFFITFTCNVKWLEITRFMDNLSPLKASDRPDIVSRVFQLKVEEMRTFLRNAHPFGYVAADLYTIEFQKRGLPHCHMLLWVTAQYKIKGPADVDKYISAEIPNPATDPLLHKIVTELMIHGPCGLARPSSPCMQDGSCSKNFPKDYNSETIFDKNGYVHYRRRPDGYSVDKAGVILDNAFVVPYNKVLCTRFQAHINVEYCGWNMMIKYLFKYIAKGPDRIRFKISKTPTAVPTTSASSSENFDEIKDFVDGRFICPHEACWRIFDFPIHQRNPPVQILAVHLENMQNVTFKDTDQLTNVIANPTCGRTTLTEWLRNNQVDESGRHLTYLQHVSEYRWDASSKFWKRRVQHQVPPIGRLVYINPTSGETFFLRMLLTHQTGCRSFADIRKVGDLILPTYRAACEKLGLLEDDNEWLYAFDEAASWASASELRTLFTHMLLYCEVSSPLTLWNSRWRQMSDDIIRNLTTNSSTTNNHINDEDLQQYVLYEIELLLNFGGSSTSLADYGLPLPNPHLLSCLKNRLLMEEKNYDREKLTTDYERLKTSLRPQQKTILDIVMTSVHYNKQALIFVYGHGGTGKTFLWTTIISGLRSQGKIVLAVAASGIASLLLPSGRTAHSRFKIPIDLTEESLCYVKKNTNLAQLLIETSLIIWDEAPMSDRRCFESLDRSLRDILDNNTKPFGGKSVLLGGDFRQTLPVKRKVSKSEIISYSLPRSYLWNSFKVFKLTENMRLYRPNVMPIEQVELATFASWLLKIGDGLLGFIDTEASNDTHIVEIPSAFIIPPSDNASKELISFIYDPLTLKNPTTTTFAEKAIVCPTNEAVDHVNSLILQKSTEQTKTYLSVDTVVPHNRGGAEIEVLYPPEYVGLLNFQGLPPHHLTLKINSPIILLRNLNQTTGLCNGTRLLVTQLLPRIIEARVITGVAAGHRVYIPRITLTHDDKELPFILKRKQFPVKLCYAMTINKSQGQSLNKIGVYLPNPVFSHGQLYVALSRATSPSALKVLVEPNENQKPNTTKNIVYSQFLHDINNHCMTGSEQ